MADDLPIKFNDINNKVIAVLGERENYEVGIWMSLIIDSKKSDFFYCRVYENVSKIKIKDHIFEVVTNQDNLDRIGFPNEISFSRDIKKIILVLVRDSLKKCKNVFWKKGLYDLGVTSADIHSKECIFLEANILLGRFKEYKENFSLLIEIRIS